MIHSALLIRTCVVASCHPCHPESPSQACEVQVVKYMENKQGEGMPLTEMYEAVSKELRVPLGNMSRWWRNNDKSSRHLPDVGASQCIAVLSPSQSCCNGLLFASLMLHSALMFGHPPKLAVMFMVCNSDAFTVH